MSRMWLLLALVLLPVLGWAQAADTAPLTINVGEDLLSSRRLFQMISLLTVLSLAPSILMMITSFTRIVIVFSFVRSAIGLQTSPPNSVLVSLALFLTFFIMQPVLSKSYTEGVLPYMNQRIDEQEAFGKTMAPFQGFMLANVNEKDLELFVTLLPDDQEQQVKLVTDAQGKRTMENLPLHALVPAFMISELRRAFEIGFLIFMPFIVIDLTIASILMSMGMMMLPPVVISLPFKIVFFVLVDGWRLLSSALVESFKV
ncbi:MAG: flagellar type III secretion system pore protein FliP [Alphaproteobacteria bacterium]